jgi:Zn-dependent membrane protease YugP
MMMPFDPTFILIIPAILLGIWAQFKVNRTYARYARIPSQAGMSGAAVARRILDSKGLSQVRVMPISGHLTDHYDPKTRVVSLSEDIYHGTSLAALGIAAHETGHALQHAEAYYPLTLRHLVFPVANLGSQLLWPLLIGSIIFSIKPLLTIGIILYSFAVIFQIVTLPVEFNASSRALLLLRNDGYLSTEEISGAQSVLSAAAMTYVAATLSAVLELVRLLLISRRND